MRTSVEAGLLPPGDGEPISSSFSLAEQEAALAAAQSFLERLDYGSIDPGRLDRAMA